MGAVVALSGSSVHSLDKRFDKYRISVNANVERLHTGCRWSEGPVWIGDQRLLIWADIPNNRLLKYDEATDQVSVFRSPSNNANGSTRDREGRLVTCEHLTRRVTRTEHDGAITVICDRYQGKRLNSPNDVVVRSDGSIWFTDPTFGIDGFYEGDKGVSELTANVYRVDGQSGAVTVVANDIRGRTACASRPTRPSSTSSSSLAPSQILVYDVVGERIDRRKVFVDCRRGHARRPAHATSTATSGAAGARVATIWTACECSRPTARPSAGSICRSAAPTSASAG